MISYDRDSNNNDMVSLKPEIETQQMTDIIYLTHQHFHSTTQ